MIFQFGKYKYEISLSRIMPLINSFQSCNIIDVDDSLSGQIMVVIGGSSGIGLSIVKEFLNHGAKVIAAARTLGELRNFPNKNLEFIKWDVSHVSESKENIEYILNKYQQINCVVLSSGVNTYPNLNEQSLLTKKKKETEFIHQINVIGVCEICKILKQYALTGVIRDLKIINIISRGALLSVPEPYYTSKHAFYSFTNAFSNECKGLIRVYGIAPGEVNTKMIHHNNFTIINERAKDHRVAHPDEVAKLALHLTLPGGNTLAGNIIVIDGGATILK